MTHTDGSKPAAFFVGIGVGTGNARAGVFDAGGTLLASVWRDIQLFRPSGDIAEQSSGDIWACVCQSVIEAVAANGVDPAAIAELVLT